MTVKRDNLVFIILCGIPCSGKSTWTEKNMNKLMTYFNAPVVVVSRDTIREAMFDMDKYRYDKKGEDEVTNRFYKQLSHAVNLKNAVIILDNTHVKPSRIDVYFTMFKAMIDAGTITMYVKFFDIPLWKAKWRNYWRNKRTGKYISDNVFEGMYKNYKKLDKSKYKEYELK
jgi:predicted kinase